MMVQSFKDSPLAIIPCQTHVKVASLIPPLVYINTHSLRRSLSLTIRCWKLLLNNAGKLLCRIFYRGINPLNE